MLLTITAYDAHVEQLRDTVRRLADAFAQAGIEYRVIGGLAVFFHVAARNPGAARATRDVDVAVNRADLAAIIEAARPIGFVHRHAAGVDMLVDAVHPGARSAVRPVLAREKVRGVLLAPVADLVRMKLTSAYPGPGCRRTHHAGDRGAALRAAPSALARSARRRVARSRKF